MAPVRVARLSTALVAVPLALGLSLAGAGAAHADNGSIADDGANSTAVTTSDSGNHKGDVNGSNYTVTPQVATGDGAANYATTVNLNETSGITALNFGPIFLRF
ncbi:hypothetical protein [Allostreptomyces psammosilenae]|uniref:Secreted protein n=1 Tax=Allostreptomyces psammosilenae TaxID=1892865 RepID=A0A852ZXQ6_9ACTN|nr:hypothetical protein [Allostreptomyces psammosilenae]NYI05504.1 hypothetical protein [Allostreptomyces psammosilenae]